MRITSVELWCADLDASLAFYRDVIGMDLGYSDPHPPDDVEHYETMFGSFEDGSATFFLLFPAGERPRSTGTYLGISVDDVEQVHKRALEAGVEVLHEPAESPFGGRAARYRDPDGNLVGVSSR